MAERFVRYITVLNKPEITGVCEILSLIFLIGTVFFVSYKGLRKCLRYSLWLLFIEYVFLLFSSTVIFRKASDGVYGYNFSPFWSYKVMQSGTRPDLLPEIIMNVVVFVPVGLLLGLLFQGERFVEKKAWLVVLLIGMGISLSIETMQLFLKRGLLELDDVIHNTFGCIIGYMLVKGSMVMVNGFCHRRIEE